MAKPLYMEFKKNFKGSYSPTTKQLIREMYLGLHKPDGVNYRADMASIARSCNIEKATLRQWKAREKWDELLAAQEASEEQIASSDYATMLNSIKLSSIQAIDKFCQENKNLKDEKELKERISGLKTILEVEKTVLSEDEREKYATNTLLEELEEFETKVEAKFN